MPAPSTGFLSEFLDPPEDPLRENGMWLPPFPNGRPEFTILDMRKESGQATDQHHGATLSGILAYSFYTLEQFQGNVEVWGLPTGGQLGAALETWRLFMWQQLDPPIGYLVYVGGGLSKDTVIRRYDASLSPVAIASSGHGYAGALMLRTNGSDLEVWSTNIGDDYTDPTKWYLRCSATDNSYRGPFYIGMGIEDPTTGGLGWEAFGGGIPRRTQFYRWLPTPADGKVGTNWRYADRRAHGIGRGLVNPSD